MRTESDRLKQIRRQWDGGLKYRVPADGEAAELHAAVADLLEEVDELENATSSEIDLWDDECDHYEAIQEACTELEAKHTARLAEFGPVVEDLHRQAHGDGSLFTCPEEPCRGLYRLLPTARGRVLA